jgi:isopentenyl-diphosphate delta-isomerase
MRLPLWVSSMTGGTADAGQINRNLARLCGEFGMGMCLGSCRIILENDKHFPDFDLRDLIGDENPFYANLGIAQVEQLLERDAFGLVDALIARLRADGLIIHVNPMQEWLQPEGDRIRQAPIETVRHALDKAGYPIIVKEVGQGMGPGSLRQVLDLPLEAIEFAAFGGTNFSRLELMRASRGDAEMYKAFAYIGHTADEMMGFINHMIDEGLVPKSRGLIISGGINSMVDAHALLLRSKMPAVIGQASAFLRHARGDYDELRNFALAQAASLRMAATYLKSSR